MNLLGNGKSILNYFELKKISIQSSLISLDGPYLIQRNFWSQQILKASDLFEVNLFKKSKTLFSFRESVVIRAKTKQGLVIDSKVLKGEFSSFKNLQEIEREIGRLDFKIRQKSFDLDYYEIIHTHPTGCYIERDGEHEVISLGGLSKSDYEVAEFLERKHSAIFKLKAICPGGITYCSI
ncbi:hypothetical protein [Halobacteriovorax sp. JY17]|uniref:hypothetical protein n=1 Tax=Halobacteriovorax sp. JY17 TaxID=2014617 RepID=UPI000C605468|nr:hypothetical protein [Halobacteriovorax sp. JY17]PIK15682.1 MAG: hypothetical protein CES88_02850 [Halobacteriovorax sp. JY17]